MSEPTTSGGGSGQNEAARSSAGGPGELRESGPGSTLAATNGPDLALRSPAPAPAPDRDEQLVVVRRAIYDARTQAGHWRQVTGVYNAEAIARQRDRHADVLEHVLRRLLAERAYSEDVGLFVQPLGGEREKQYFRLDVTGGRMIVRALGIEGEPRIVDMDMGTAVETLVRYLR